MFLIRHGKTKGNLEHRYIGRTDESLCEKGKEELLRRRAPEVQRVYASPMRRCIQTAEILYPAREFLKVEDFRECDFGRFEGKNYQELSKDPGYQAWIDSGGSLAFPGGESPADGVYTDLNVCWMAAGRMECRRWRLLSMAVPS